MRPQIFFRLLAVFVLMIAATAVAIGFFVRQGLESSLYQEIERNLKQKTLMLAARVNSDRKDNLQDLISQEAHAGGARATVIDVAGKVLADSEASAPSMDNLAKNVEFVAALSGEIGTDIRRSRALGIPILYVAAAISVGAVRLAYPLSDLDIASSRLWSALVLGAGFALLLALALAGAAAQFPPWRFSKIRQVSRWMVVGNLTPRDEVGHPASPGANGRE